MLQHLLGYILISLYHISNLQCLELEEGSDNEDNVCPHCAKEMNLTNK